MAALLIADVKSIVNDKLYDRYVAEVPVTVAAACGVYLARGGTVEVLEGSWRPNRLVVVRFPSTEAACAWWASPEYAALRVMRQESADTNMVVVQQLGEA